MPISNLFYNIGMKKAKLIACLSILSASAVTPAFLSSCSKTKTYTIMNWTATTYVAAAANIQEYDVALCNDIFVVDPNHKVVSIDTTKSTYSVEAPKDLITDVQIVSNAKNGTIGVLAKVNGWNGEPIIEGAIVLKLKLVLENGNSIECKTNILLRHDYIITPNFPYWLVKGAGDSNQFQIKDGLDAEQPTTGFTWKITEVPSEHANDVAFDNSTPGLLKYNATAPTNPYKIVISAEKDDYLIEHELWIASKS